MTLKIPSSSDSVHTYTPTSRLLTPSLWGLFSFPIEFSGLQVSDLGQLRLPSPAQLITLLTATSGAWCWAPWPGSPLLPAPPPAISHPVQSHSTQHFSYMEVS